MIFKKTAPSHPSGAGAGTDASIRLANECSTNGPADNRKRAYISGYDPTVFAQWGIHELKFKKPPGTNSFSRYRHNFLLYMGEMFLHLLAWQGPMPAHDILAWEYWPQDIPRRDLGTVIRELARFGLIRRTKRKRCAGAGQRRWLAPVWEITDRGIADLMDSLENG